MLSLLLLIISLDPTLVPKLEVAHVDAPSIEMPVHSDLLGQQMQVSGGQMQVSGGQLEGATAPTVDLTSTAIEACGFDDDSSEYTPVQFGDFWICHGMSAAHNARTATTR